MLSGICSGAFVAKNGLVLTSAHCFRGGKVKKIFIKTHDRVSYPGFLVDIDNENDLALVLAPEIKLTPYFPLATKMRVGEQVMSFGSPMGIQSMVTVGYISRRPEKYDMYIMFHTAFINPGNSGGPLVNMRGELVGVNRGMISLNPFTPAQGLNIAIPFQSIKPLVDAHK